MRKTNITASVTAEVASKLAKKAEAAGVSKAFYNGRALTDWVEKRRRLNLKG